MEEVARPTGNRESRPGEQSIPADESLFLKGLLDGMRCGILVIDRRGRIVLLNELAAQILDLDRAPAPGAESASVLAAHPRLVRILDNCFTVSRLPNREELTLGSKPGAGKTIGYTLSHVAFDGREPVGAAIFFKDLTQIEHKQERERLRDRLAALGRMAASMAHEVRNPLASIEVTCSLLRRRLDGDPQGRELVDKITAEVRRLNQTITTSLEFVRPVNLDLETVRIVPVLEEAIAVAVERRNDPSIRIDTRFQQPIAEFLMDRAQLRQVFENLILNAVEAVGRGGTVTVEAELVPASEASSSPPLSPAGWLSGEPQPIEQFVVVRVSDTGPGISQVEMDKIFYPFFTTKEQGSGVGLSTVKKIVDSHHGLIDVDNAPGGGAVFSVRLPMVQKTGG